VKAFVAKYFRDTTGLSSEEPIYAVQLILSRIVLRICEGRDIEKYETLRKSDEVNV
jgi:hypothetical protein